MLLLVYKSNFIAVFIFVIVAKMGNRSQKRKSCMKKNLKRLFLNLDVDSKGYSRPLDTTCSSDPRDVGDETFLYFKDIPEPFPLNKLNYIKSDKMLPGIAEHLLKWLDMGVLQLLDNVNKDNYLAYITCFIPFFVLNCKDIMFPGEKEPRLISDMTANGVNKCCYSLKWKMDVVLEHVKNWSPDTVFVTFDLSKAYLQVRIPEPIRRFFGIYLPNFPGSPFGKEIFGVMTGMPWGFKPAGFILRHQTDWIIRELRVKFPWLGYHLWVDDFLFYLSQSNIDDVPELVSEFDSLVSAASHERNKKKSITTPVTEVVHNGININVLDGIISLPENKCSRIIGILEFTSTATDNSLLAVPISEWETYKGVLNYVGYIIPLLKCWLSPWYKFCLERNVRPSCSSLRESATEMLLFIRKHFKSNILTRKMHLTSLGKWTLWDYRFKDVTVDRDTLIITVDSSSLDTGIFIPRQFLHDEVRVSLSRTDLGNSCANELHGALYAATRYGGTNRRVIIFNDNKATVTHINNARARSKDSNFFVQHFVNWLTCSGSAVVAQWVPGVLLHHADDQSRVSDLQTTKFYVSGALISESSLFLFDPTNLKSSVWVWEGLVHVFEVLCPRYVRSANYDRVYAEKYDSNGHLLYDKLIPGSFLNYVFL